MLVTVNCYAALKRLRKTDGHRLLWVDAICINQSLIPERNHQLGLMARIYHNATRVVVYLGEAADESDAAMNWIREIDDSGEDPWLMSRRERPPGPTDKTPLQALFRRPWFNRMWVLQEISLASEAIVVCGEQEVNWISFYHFYHWNVSEKWLKELPYSVKYQASRKPGKDGPRLETRLLKMLANARYCGATDPRDKLYGILPLLEWDDQKTRDLYVENDSPDSHTDKLDLAIKPDYALSPSQVFTDLAARLMQYFGLDMLQEVSNPPLVSDLPSWVPDWTISVPRNSERQSYPTFLSTEFSAGSKTRTIPIWQRGFSAYQRLTFNEPTWRLSNYSRIGADATLQLHVRGVRVDKIKRIGEICNIQNNIFPLEQWSTLSSDPKHYGAIPTPEGISEYDERHWNNGPEPLSPFFRVLTADDVVYPDVIVDAVDYIHQYNATGPYLGKEVASDQGDLAKVFKGWPHSYKVQSKRILNTCDGKRFFVTETGYIGLAPGTAKAGDDVFVLEGASSPFVFRKSDHEFAHDGSLLVSRVGNGYVQGIMHGELWEYFGKRDEQMTIR